MRNILLATAGLLALSSGLALAADLPVKAPPMVAPPPQFSWTGFYLGGNLGFKNGKFHETLSSPTASLDFSSSGTSGIVGGGQIGYLWQTNQFVFGFEGDFDGTNLRRSRTAVSTVGPFIPGDTLTVRNDWQASARGRLGWAVDHALFYVTGGGSWANFKADFFPVGLVATSADRTLFGWTFGGGIDYAFANGWSLGGEYRFTRYENSRNSALGTLVGTPVTLSSTLDTNELTARISYHFNAGGGGLVGSY
jgi:outer membrane immunogenic protein